MKKLEMEEVLFFGELLKNPIAQWIQLEVTKSLQERFFLLGEEILSKFFLP